MVALHRRDTAELLAEELRRLDPDEVYAETLHHVGHAPGRGAWRKGEYEEDPPSRVSSNPARVTAHARAACQPPTDGEREVRNEHA